MSTSTDVVLSRAIKALSIGSDDSASASSGANTEQSAGRDIKDIGSTAFPLFSSLPIGSYFRSQSSLENTNPTPPQHSSLKLTPIQNSVSKYGLMPFVNQLSFQFISHLSNPSHSSVTAVSPPSGPLTHSDLPPPSAPSKFLCTSQLSIQKKGWSSTSQLASTSPTSLALEASPLHHKSPT